MEALFERAKAVCRMAVTVADVGIGIRPQQIVHSTGQYVGVDPHREYLDRLAAKPLPPQCSLFCGTALQFLDSWVHPKPDFYVLLDVIEHMEKDDGKLLIERISATGASAMVFTPLGFQEQAFDGTTDSWGMRGGYWQTHRSGWVPDEFPGWTILTDEHFHGPFKGAFIAISPCGTAEGKRS